MILHLCFCQPPFDPQEPFLALVEDPLLQFRWVEAAWPSEKQAVWSESTTRAGSR